MNIKIDRKSHKPIYMQIVEELTDKIISGEIRRGEKLPSIRSLSSKLEVTTTTVHRAYKYLEEEGVIETLKGKRSTVVSIPDDVKKKSLEELYRDFVMEARKMGYSEREIMNMFEHGSMDSILAIDVGSTMTKAVLFLRDSNGNMAFEGKSQSKTTVESEEEDVWIGVIRAVEKLEKKTGRKILRESEVMVPSENKMGVDVFLSTSSAGGGLQMLTVGLVRHYTGESAERTALGAGAIVMDVIAIDDNRTLYEKLTTMKELRPDIILFSGGIEGGAVSGVVQLSEILSFSEIKGKFGDYKPPVVYAGNSEAWEFIKMALEDNFDLTRTDNIRPTMKDENPYPARREILRIFMEHVMKRAPGYDKLNGSVSLPLLPTPGSVFQLLKEYTEHENKNVLAFDVGGATTDVFSSIKGNFNRTVDANIGMRYSLFNTLKRAGEENIFKWIPFSVDRKEIMDKAANLMVHPSHLASDEFEKEIEIAFAKEILRVALDDHKKLIRRRKEDYKDVMYLFYKENLKSDEWNLGRADFEPLLIDMVIGSGGVLTSQDDLRTLEIMIDGFNSSGITEFLIDRAFMFPQLGCLSTVKPALALDLMERESLKTLATVVSPEGEDEPGQTAVIIEVDGEEYEVKTGEYRRIKPASENVELSVKPSLNFDVGLGKGKSIEKVVRAGIFGIICDARITPLQPDKERIKEWRNILRGNNE